MHSVDRKIIADILGQTLNGPATIPISIDSRTLTAGSIFFALRGEFHDGHDYIDQALAQGAMLVVAEKNHPALKNKKTFACVLVDDSLQSFARLAHAHLMSMPAQRIALTGSNGKTTTKEMIKAALGAVLGYELIAANAGTFNNHFGVPLSALAVRPEHKIALFELGMNHSGEIKALCDIIEPQVGLLLNIGAAHEGNFSDGIEGVQKAKGELLYAVKSAVINIDDERVLTEALKHKFIQQISFGRSSKADIRLVSSQLFCLQKRAQQVCIEADGELIEFSIPLPGAHHALNACAALAVVKALSLPIKKAALGLSRMQTALGRMSLSLSGGYVVINDAYNANPVSMRAGIDAALEFEAARRIAVIGAMGELGSSSEQHHRELGQLLSKHFAYILVSGERAFPVVEGAKSQGFAPENIYFEKEPEKLLNPLRGMLRPGDLVFIKGSKSANMQTIALALNQR